MRWRWALIVARIAAAGAVTAVLTPGLRAQVPDDAKRADLEAKIATVWPLACVPAATPSDPAVTALKAALDALALQYGPVLDAQIAALNAGKAPNLNADDQKWIAASRQARRDKLGSLQICDPSTQGLFTAANGAAAAPAALKTPAPPSSAVDKLSFTPGVVRAVDQEVSDQGQASVTIKNNGDDPVRLGAAQVCLHDRSNCQEQGEIFQVADGTDKCNNPMAKTDQCSLKILFTPKRAFSYSQWLEVPLVGSDGKPTKNADGKDASPLMIPLQGNGFVANMARVEASGVSANHPSLRSIVGLDIGGATSTDTQQKVFVDFALNAPIGSSSHTVCLDDTGVPLTNKDGTLNKDGAKAHREKALADLERARAGKQKAKADEAKAKTDEEKTRAQVDWERAQADETKALADLERAKTDEAKSEAKTKPGGAKATSDGDKGTIIRSYEDCQNLIPDRKEENKHVRYIWKDKRSDPLNSPWWWYFNPRITSTPQQASALSGLNVQGFTDSLTGQKTNLVQGVDVQGGVEFMIVKPREGRAFYGSFKNTKQRLGIAWVTGVGFASPFAAPGNNPTVFSLDAKSPLRHQFQATGSQFCGATSPCDIPASFTNITFVNEERSRFFRRYYTGLRLKTYHFSKAFESHDCDTDYKNECEGVYNAYPGLADLTVGQDEQVSGGHLSRWVFRLDVAYPLPFVPGTYIFGGVNSLFQKNKNTTPLFVPGTSATAISDPSVFLVNVPLRNRDNYRLGLGVDLLQVITQAKQAGNKNAGGSGGTTQQIGAANDKAAPAAGAAKTASKNGAAGETAAPAPPASSAKPN